MAQHALPLDQAAFAHMRVNAMPRPHQLAALGAVLCLHRAEQGAELAGWTQAVRVETRTGLDSDGLREALHFFDVDGRCCWQIHLLPDSDFFAWERLISQLPVESAAESSGGIGERLWRRLAGCLRGGQWRATGLQLHALATTSGTVLAASPALLSTLGVVTARTIAQAESADAEALSDACCCAQSAVASTSKSTQADYTDAVMRLNAERGVV